ITAFFTFARPASSIVYTIPLYGGTMRLIHEFLEPFGVSGIPVVAGDTEALGNAIRTAHNPSIVFIETPANPSAPLPTRCRPLPRLRVPRAIKGIHHEQVCAADWRR